MRTRVLLIIAAMTLAPAAARGAPATASAQADPGRAPPRAAPEAPELDESEPAPADGESLRAQARLTQSRAARLFREGHYVEAAALLRQAYQADPRPIFLFNAGQACRIAERPAEARALYEEFLAVAPSHALAQEARAYLKDMEALLAMQQRTREVALALEEQLSATEIRKQQALKDLEQERLRAQQIQQSLLTTQAQLDRDRQKLAARKRWILGLSIGIPVVVGAVIGGTIGAVSYTRSSTDGGTAQITK